LPHSDCFMSKRGMSNRGPRRPPAGPPTRWSRDAEWYDQLVGDEGSEYQRHVIFPGVLRLLGPVAGRDVLDVACGQGALCRVLQRAGAKATGVDASAPLLRMARQRGEAAITYVHADARDLSVLPQGRFAAAVCVLAIQNIHPLPPLLAGIARCLQQSPQAPPPGAESAAIQPRLVLVMMHPCFRGPKHTAWGWDEEAKVQFRRVDRYLLPRKEPIVMHPGSDPSHYTWTFHRPLEAYVKALRSAGFLIDAIEEWPGHKESGPGPRAAAENLARKEIPMFLAIRAVQPLWQSESPGLTSPPARV
jgi:ubiquinone/menaquinone biosynthesis C-methylase UbiE